MNKLGFLGKKLDLEGEISSIIVEASCYHVIPNNI